MLNGVAILLAVALLASLAAGCNGGGSGAETPQADGGNGDGEGDADFPTAELPEELPESFPIFSPAEVLFGASRAQGNTPLSSFAQWLTDASPTEVTEFYEDGLDKDPWMILNANTTPDGGVVIVFTSTDEESSGVLTVGIDEKWGTTFTVSFSDDAAP
jgi:hypothetical protein